jgi:hypothetical protein
MKPLILTVAGLFALMALGLLVGCVLSVSMWVVAAFRSKPDRKASLAQELIAGENRARRREMPPGG